jgi:hypothetical protein
MAEMMRNPMIQRMMQDMMQDPNMINQVTHTHTPALSCAVPSVPLHTCHVWCTSVYAIPYGSICVFALM